VGLRPTFVSRDPAYRIFELLITKYNLCRSNLSIGKEGRRETEQETPATAASPFSINNGIGEETDIDHRGAIMKWFVSVSRGILNAYNNELNG
jgi:hypothetical protein